MNKKNKNQFHLIVDSNQTNSKLNFRILWPNCRRKFKKKKNGKNFIIIIIIIKMMMMMIENRFIQNVLKAILNTWANEDKT